MIRIRLSNNLIYWKPKYEIKINMLLNKEWLIYDTTEYFIPWRKATCVGICDKNAGQGPTANVNWQGYL